MTFYPRDARRFSRLAEHSRYRRYWAWVANCYRLRGFDDDRCVLEATRAVSTHQAFLDKRHAPTEAEVPLGRRHGAFEPRTDGIPAKIRARAAIRAAARERKRIARRREGE